MRVKEIVWGGILTSLALIIPLAFGGVLGITIPPFSATLASHVPVMLSMLISPLVAFMVAAGSALGFLIKLGPVIGARAAMHIIFAVFGAYMLKRGSSFQTALLATLPIHAASEALIVLPFGFTLQKAGVVVGIGTALHHGADSLIALAVYTLIGLAIPRTYRHL
ncbi:MAG: ECF transporter S component [Peptococcaceae bacterium]|nr:ECF transporter S component [Peptococcaceae bacterium]MDH7523797.1 ECF transporter S component [Peptococcaceae bacterium]